MEFKLKDGKIILFFEGELNSSNSEEIYAESENILKKEHFDGVILNFAKITYVSSAGLRIVLRLKQQYGDVIVVETSLEVYDVFNMTGFTNIMEVKKGLKAVDITGAKVIGTGFFSTVYRIDKDTIIKVFNRTSDTDQIERELKRAKQAFILGIPTAISFDIVRVGEKLGVRFEMLDCESLKDAFLNHPENYDKYIEKYSELIKKITSTECLDPTLPDVKKFYLEKIESIKEHLESKYYEQLKEMFEKLPDAWTFVHGDCHFKNIMVQGEDLLLIDMDTLSRGCPIFELAGLRVPYVAFDEDDPGNCERFLGVPKDLVIKIYQDLIRNYFGKYDEDIESKLAIVCYVHMVWRNRTNEPDNKVRLEGCRGRLYKLLDKYNDLDLGF